MSDLASVPVPEADWAFFLDVDGTLLEIAPTPQGVTVDARVIGILANLSRAADGAVALVSGRPLGQLDRLFRPLRLPAAGLHGLETRTARGRITRPPRPVASLARVREALCDFVRANPGLLLEDKGLTLAFHWRLAPSVERELHRRVRAVAADVRAELHVLEGKKVLEFRPMGADKGTAVEALMNEPPFVGRRPVFIGDDLTDEDGFRAANRLGGSSIRIGACEATAAKSSIGDVGAFHRWLALAPSRMARGAPAPIASAAVGIAGRGVSR